MAALRQVGIQPDAIVCRADRDIPDGVKRKISLMCDVDTEAVVAAVDAPSIYDIPKVLHREGLDAYVVRRLGLNFRDVDWADWDRMLQRVHDPEHTVEIALVGKYIDLPMPISRSPRRCGPAASTTTRGSSCAGSPRTSAPPTRARPGRSPVSTPSSSPAVSGCAASTARSALCAGPASARSPPSAVPGPAVHGHRVRPHRPRHRRRLVERVRPLDAEPGRRDDGGAEGLCRGAGNLGGTMRLGTYPAVLRPGSVVAKAYAATEVNERHRHRYEVNNAYRERLEQAGLQFSGTSPDGTLVEFAELPADVHPYYVSTQAHPSSSPGRIGHTRSSPGSSSRPWPGSAPNGSSRSSATTPASPRDSVRPGPARRRAA